MQRFLSNDERANREGALRHAFKEFIAKEAARFAELELGLVIHSMTQIRDRLLRKCGIGAVGENNHPNAKHRV
jgi:hypothetical protein